MLEKNLEQNALKICVRFVKPIKLPTKRTYLTIFQRYFLELFDVIYLYLCNICNHQQFCIHVSFFFRSLTRSVSLLVCCILQKFQYIYIKFMDFSQLCACVALQKSHIYTNIYINAYQVHLTFVHGISHLYKYICTS